MMCRVAIVTGSNKGIGLATVAGLCDKFDGIVYLTSRDEGRGLKAVEELRNRGLHPAYHQLDIDDINSINTFRDFIKKKHGGIDCLINNAATAYEYSAAGANMSIEDRAVNNTRTNYTGTLNVCKALFPLLRDHARVVNVSSSAGVVSRLPNKELRERFRKPDVTEEQLTELMKEFVEAAKDGTCVDKGWGTNTYVVSKIGVSALTGVQQRHFDNDIRKDLVVNAVHPGKAATASTDFTGTMTPEEASVASLYCALLPHDVTEPRGNFIWFDKTIKDWTQD